MLAGGAYTAYAAPVRNVLIETLVLAAVGIVLAIAANAVSPRGLQLNRDYFPSDRSQRRPNGQTNHVATASATGTNIGGPDLLIAQLSAQGLQLAETAQVTTLFRDPRFAQGLIIFVDARNDEHFQEGRIPGAYQLDHFHPERYIATVLPACQTAEQIVVYCSGGTCDDSLQTAIFLRDAGIPKERLSVYAGGLAEWTSKGLPVETGPRK